MGLKCDPFSGNKTKHGVELHHLISKVLEIQRKVGNLPTLVYAGYNIKHIHIYSAEFIQLLVF